MTIIPIDLASIKKNPRGGSTSTLVVGPREISWRFNGLGQIPEELSDKVIITSWETVFGEPFFKNQAGVLINPADVELIAGIKGIIIQDDSRPIRIDHLPESNYFYTYLVTKVPCENCHSFVDHDDIIEEYMEGCGYSLECPICHERDTFNFNFESFNEKMVQCG